MPFIRAGVIFLVVIMAVFINVRFYKEAKTNDSSQINETVFNNELNQIEEAVNFNNIIEIPVNIIDKKLSNKLILSFFDECWIEIYSHDELILNKLFKYGDSYEFEIERPFKIVVGNVDAIEASYNGNNIDFITNANRLNVSTIIINDE